MLLLYRIVFVLVLIAGSPYLLIRAIWGRHGISERFGFIPKRESSGRLFWFHAASVGELKVLSSIIPEIKRLLPGVEIAVSTTTATGKKRATELFGKEALIFYQPLELNSAILRTLENLRPEKLILVETEIWPLLISTVFDAGVEINLINARMSRKSFRIYSLFWPFISKILARFTHILAQTEDDARRYGSLGATDPRVVGNMKYDQVLANSGGRKSPPKIKDKRNLIFVAGSIRRGEDRIFADIIAQAMEASLPVFFVLVPRHMKDLGELEEHLRSNKVPFRLWTESRKRKIDPGSVLIVNTMGELTDFYKSSDLAFVGGSLVPIGGHDPTEPAALGKPVIFGHYMDNAQAAARLLIECGGAVTVRNGADILRVLYHAVENRAALQERGKRCREAIRSMAGISRKIAGILVENHR